jgi:hypothetical protein
MTTQEVAEQLLALVNEGKNLQAEEELYAQDVVSHEPDARGTVSGLENVMAKTRQAFESFEEFYGATNTLVGVNGDTFLMSFEMDLKPKGGERMTMKEFGLYRVADGKVVEEHFYF